MSKTTPRNVGKPLTSKGTVIEGAFGTEHDAKPQRAKRANRERVRVSPRMSAWMRGEINPEDLTVEELVRGQMRGKDGQWHLPPKLVPRDFYQLCMRELLKRGEELFQENYLEAIRIMLEIANDTSQDAATRARCAQYVIERVAGKTPDKVELTFQDPWQQAIAGIVAEVEDEQIEKAKVYLRDNT